jgi:hypothetical protein
MVPENCPNDDSGAFVPVKLHRPACFLPEVTPSLSVTLAWVCACRMSLIAQAQKPEAFSARAVSNIVSSFARAGIWDTMLFKKITRVAVSLCALLQRVSTHVYISIDVTAARCTSLCARKLGCFCDFQNWCGLKKDPTCGSASHMKLPLSSKQQKSQLLYMYLWCRLP